MYVAPITSGSIITPIQPLFNQDNEKTETLLGGLGESGGSFQSKLLNAINEIKGMEDQSEQYSYELAMGNSENLEAMMINTAKLNTTVDLATTITSRVVSTYKEIMQMQI
ncbi:MAG: flagellar hook-basal body complex protein FliE [Oscillospiraceae bacterium]|jgi:flagellar hook-basal body complex protein FliE|nr:flagellar hook-basal body complex protein FliE [Oscillospiraceae bacterium]